MSFCHSAAVILLSMRVLPFAWAADASAIDYRVLATSKTSTMEKEMNAAADAGFRFAAVMGGDTSVGGKEVVVVMMKDPAQGDAPKLVYKLLATARTSTMQKEMQQLGDEGFEYKGQTVFESAFGGKEVTVIMEGSSAAGAGRIEYRLLATKRTSTMQKELQQQGEEGFLLLGMTVGKTAVGGSELVSILRKR
ncbi:hypothetical protein [uncultured Paludibaculum sp.]|uniref:hypothetical protein n=1 Tax=uncultured Paludibaculum sp. TaxID=1765020 RepID=UPI002AAABA17|nr:hypothetical protein [uncultured Paludibaculum sp.]